MDRISKSVSAILGECGIIQKDDIDKCRYGLDVFLSSVLEMLSIVIISIFVKNFAETLLFFTAFIPLRIYAGGYHADTRLRCYGVLLVIYALFSVAMKLIPASAYIFIECISALFTSIMVLRFAPISHSNKHINDMETQQYKKISIAIALMEVAIMIIGLLLFQKSTLLLAFTFGQLSVSLSMITALIKNLLAKGGKTDEEASERFEKRYR